MNIERMIGKDNKYIKIISEEGHDALLLMIIVLPMQKRKSQDKKFYSNLKHKKFSYLKTITLQLELGNDSN